MPTIRGRLTALAAIDAIAGQEQPLVAYHRGALAPVCDEVTVDAVGNLYAVRRGPREQERSAVRPHTEMSVDVGADPAASVAAMGIAVGDPVAFVSEVVSLGHEASRSGANARGAEGTGMVGRRRSMPERGRIHRRRRGAPHARHDHGPAAAAPAERVRLP